MSRGNKSRSEKPNTPKHFGFEAALWAPADNIHFAVMREALLSELLSDELRLLPLGSDLRPPKISVAL